MYIKFLMLFLGIYFFTGTSKAEIGFEKNTKIPEIETILAFSYPKTNGESTPFSPKNFKKNSKKLLEETKSSLNKFPLKLLRFKGILRDESTTWALISSPDKKIAAVKVGDCLGNNQGILIQLDSKFLKIEEHYFFSERWIKKIKTLYLDEKESK